MAGSNWMFKKPVDEFEKHLRPRPSLPTSAYTSPRPVPKVPSIASSIRSVFSPQRKSKGPAVIGIGSSASTSALSLRSGDLSDPSQNTSTYSVHDAPSMPKAPSRDVTEEEAECPVCLEPLSFSYRLPGEKPHIIPECGHALHEACFSAVYEPPPGSSKVGVIKKSNLGVCGVCRRPMKVGDGDGGKSNKLAALTGMGDPGDGTFYPGRDTPASLRAFPRTQSTLHRAYDPNEDDPVDHTGSIKSQDGHGSSYVVAPSIQVRSEFPTITRTTDPSQPLTCIVAIELPGDRPPNAVPVPWVIETFPVVKPTMLDSRTSSTIGSPRPESPPQYTTTATSLQRSRSAQALSPMYTTSLQDQSSDHVNSVSCLVFRKPGKKMDSRDVASTPPSPGRMQILDIKALLRRTVYVWGYNHYCKLGLEHPKRPFPYARTPCLQCLVAP